MKKVIYLDWGLFLHSAIFGWEIRRVKKEKNINELSAKLQTESNQENINKIKEKIKKEKESFHPPATYSAWMSALCNLRKIGVDPDQDLVIVAIDGRGNWRRDVDPAYKANRKEKKKKDQIDWLDWYKKFDNFIEKIKLCTPFMIIRIEKLEADDIIATGTRFYKDYENIIVSSDSDFEQLTAQKNVKLFSPVTGKYKVVTKNPYQSLAEKIKQERTDNLISPVLDRVDFERRKMIVSLLELPEWVENKVIDEFKSFKERDFNVNLMPFPSLRKRFMEIYNSDGIETYEKAVKHMKRKRSTKKKCTQ